MTIRHYKPSFSNIQIVGCGEGGTTAGRVYTRKRFKTQREAYLNALEDFYKEIKTYLPSSHKRSRHRKKVTSSCLPAYEPTTLTKVGYERIIIGKSPSIQEPTDIQDREKVSIIPNRKEKQCYSTDLFDTVKKIVAEYNKNNLECNLNKFLSNISKNEQKLLKEYFDSITNGFLRILSHDNSCSIVLKNPKKDKILKIVRPIFL